jgi:hypothetical protein
MSSDGQLMKKALATGISAAINCFPVWAQNATRIGLWKSIDEKTGKTTALVRIAEIKGKFQGRIEKVSLSRAN